MKVFLFIISILLSLINYNKKIKVNDVLIDNVKYNSLTNVCTSGNLTSYYEDNLLIDGFHRANKYDGIYEISDNNKTSLIMPTTSKYQLSFIFSTNLDDFSSRKRLDKLGFEININRDSREIKEEYLYKINHIKDLFVKSGNKYNQKINISSSYFKISFNGEIYLNYFILTFNMSLFKNDRLNLFKLYYSDNPIYIKNIILTYKNISILDYINRKDNYLKCFLNKDNLQYNSNINLNVDYNRLISLNYLLYNYVKYDKSNERYCIFDDYEDINNYYQVGLNSKIGDKYKLILYYNISNIRNSLVINLKIIDSLPPEIKSISENEITCSYLENINSLVFINKYFKIEDNYSKSLKLNVCDENNNVIENKIGKIKSKIIAVDEFNNKSEYYFILNLIDDVPPIIERKYTHVYLNENYTLSYKEILDIFTSIDKIDGTCQIKIIENTYSSNEIENKRNVIKVESKDKSNNTSISNIVIDVNKENPICFISEKRIKIIKCNNKIKNNFILDILKESNQIDDINYNKVTIENDIDLNSLNEGTYQIKINLYSTSKVEKINLEIEMEEENKKETNKSFFDKFIDFFKNIFRKINDFFSNLFK